MVLKGSLIMDRANSRSPLTYTMVVEQENSILKILKNALVNIITSISSYSHANRTITKLYCFFKHKLPCLWEKSHQISIHTQINLGEAKAR